MIELSVGFIKEYTNCIKEETDDDLKPTGQKLKLLKFIDFLLDDHTTIERDTAESCIELVKNEMSNRLNVNRSWTSFAEEAIRDHFNLVEKP